MWWGRSHALLIHIFGQKKGGPTHRHQICLPVINIIEAAVGHMISTLTVHSAWTGVAVDGLTTSINNTPPISKSCVLILLHYHYPHVDCSCTYVFIQEPINRNISNNILYAFLTDWLWWSFNFFPLHKHTLPTVVLYYFGRIQISLYKWKINHILLW